MNASTDHPTPPDYTTSDADVFAAEKLAIAARRKALNRSDAAADTYVGLALSGGGIRSASFSLGVLQALDTKRCIGRIDYLSTVSGGGYIGCSLTATMNQSGGDVPFNEAKGGFGDTDAVQHIRDFSNYLMPRGLRDLVTSFGLIGRGWAANVILFAPFFLFSVLWLLWAYPTLESLCDYGPMQSVFVSVAKDHQIWFMPGFPDTTLLIALSLILLNVWALWRSVENLRSAGRDVSATALASTEFHGPFVKAWKIMLGLVALVAWLELQPLVLATIKPLHAMNWLQTTFNVWFTVLTPYLAPVSAFIAFMSRNLSRATSTRQGSRASTLVKRLLAKATLWGAALILPSAIWYLYLLQTLRLMPATSAEFLWLWVLIVVFVVAAFFIDPNATSLHRLYRDRLSKAFLFDADPEKRVKDKDLAEIAPKLHEIKSETCPYPIINAALNLEGSAFANRRGRNADFFEFTPLYTGSEATGWLSSGKMSALEPKLDLGTAMAISGAAVSPNMGSATIKPLVPTLAVLNLRLGFWLRNPRFALETVDRWTNVLERRCFLLFKEFFSRIDETSRTVYVTDGGNIENLGVHALLKRRCKLIVAVDAEADPAMTFGAYLKLQRYARIDLGVLLDLPWQRIRDNAVALDKTMANAETVPAPIATGHHIAVGTIRYDDDVRGLLVYVKASVTGDENDYILDYKARNVDFPHETTGDQFFGEEQLEVYRALGFHIMRYFLDERASFEVSSKPGETVDEARERVMAMIRTLLDPRDPKTPPSHQLPQVPIDDQPRNDARQKGDGGGDEQDGPIALQSQAETPE